MINPVFGDDGTFWISFMDLLKNFRTLNVCKIGDWEEVRVKGLFTNYPTQESQTLKSKNQFEITVTAPKQ